MWGTGSMKSNTDSEAFDTEDSEFEPWHKIIHPIFTYNPDTGTRPDNVRLSGQLSPLSNFILNTFIHCIGKRNLIVAIPNNIFKLIPIISYLYAFKMKKSVIAFTQEKGSYLKEKISIKHNRNYHLLNRGGDFHQGGKYLFEEIPIGYLSEGAIEARVYLPRARKELRRTYIEIQKKNFLKDKGPKILLYRDENNSRIVNTIQEITLDRGRMKSLDVKIEPGLLVFENADRFVYSSYSLEIFMKWVSPLLDEGVDFLFHFANPYSEFLRRVKNETSSFVASFGSFLLDKGQLRHESEKYFESKGNSAEYSFLMKYNVDSPDSYCSDKQFEIIEPLLEVGNIDYHYEKAKEILNKINERELVSKMLYYKMRRLLFILYDIVINPSKYKESYGDESEPWRYYTIPQLMAILRSRFSLEREKNRTQLGQLVSEIYCIYLELKECMRYGEKKTYSRVAKDYGLFEKVRGMLLEERNKLIILATSTPLERRIIREELEDLGIRGPCVLTIDEISRSLFSRPEATIIFPGRLRMKNFSELMLPYNRIFFLAYSGNNYFSIKNQIDLLLNYPSDRASTLLRFLEEIYSFLNIKKDDFLLEYNDRRGTEALAVDSETSRQEESSEDAFEEIRNTLIKETKFSDYRAYEDEMKDIENNMNTLENEKTRREGDLAVCYEASLRKMDSNCLLKRLLPASKTYLYAKTINGKLEEGTPRNLKSGYFIVILDNDERKTSLDLIIEVFDLEGSIDKNLIAFWKQELIGFVEKHDVSFMDLYNMYVDKGGKRNYQTIMNWAKGNVLGPEDPSDLRIIGEIIEEEQISENYRIIDEEINRLRIIHRNTGRMLGKIVRKMLNGKLNASTLSFEEYRLFERVQNGLYRIVDIRRPIAQ